jgi:hypothetical protein
MKKAIYSVMTLLLVPAAALFSTPARADSRGQQIIDKLDKLATGPTDQYFVFDMTTYEKGKDPSTMVFEVTIKGTRFRLVRFLSPGDIKGTRMLVRSLSQMYIYLPAYRRVRRIASHVRDQGFMGSAYSYDEMAIVSYGDVFYCDLASETDTLYKLKCKRKPGKEFHFPIMEMDIRKDIHRPAELRFFNEKGVKLKTDYRTEYDCNEDNSICNPKKMKLVDHTRGDIYTTMICKKWKKNTGVKDNFFTLRSLQK